MRQLTRSAPVEPPTSTDIGPRVVSPGPPVSRRRWRGVGQSAWIYRLATLVLFAGAWEIFAIRDGGLLIPTFSETVVSLGQLLLDSQMWYALYVSNQALVIGFGISVVAGIPLGLTLGRFRRAERLLDVYLDILLVVPMAALIPILVMSVGIGLNARVLLVVLFSIVMVVVNARAGVRQVHPSLIEMALNLGATERQLWRKILLPGALPAIMTGVRLGLGRAVTGMIIVELLMVSVGLGGLMIEYRAMFNGPDLYSLVIIVVVEALLLITFVKALERRIIPYARAPRGLS